jgi:dUTP pyrophosphatase
MLLCPHIFEIFLLENFFYRKFMYYTGCAFFYIMKVRIFMLQADIPIPKFHTVGSVGFDIAASETVNVSPKDITMIPTGLVIETPPGYALFLVSRSSTPKKFGITPPHGIGLIDQDYSGPDDEIRILVRNFTDDSVVVSRGDRIAQGVFVRTEQAEFVLSDFSDRKSRGGFGSTG